MNGSFSDLSGLTQRSTRSDAAAGAGRRRRPQIHRCVGLQRGRQSGWQGLMPAQSQRGQQRGQALVMGVVLLLICAATLFYVVRTSLATVDRSRSENIADAAAYSAAVWRARVMNYDAYANRAIVANEVMIAQAITMQSWTQYVAQVTRNAATVTTFLPPVSRVIGTIARILEFQSSLTHAGVRLEVPARSAWTQALELSQDALHAAADPFVMQGIADEIVWSTDPSFHAVTFWGLGDNFRSLTTRYQGADRAPLAELVDRSLDSFTRRRGFDLSIPFLPTIGCIPQRLDQWHPQLIRRGGTSLSADFQTWSAGDTYSLQGWSRRGGFFGSLNPFCARRSEWLPLGWGAAETADPAVPLDRDRYDLHDNPWATDLAESEVTSSTGYRGLSGFREITEGLQPQDARNRIAVVVKLPMTRAQANNVSGGAGRLSMWGTRADGDDASGSSADVSGSATSPHISAMAVGEVYFERPRGSTPTGAVHEYPTAFSPYWQARLIAPTAQERLTAAARARWMAAERRD